MKKQTICITGVAGFLGSHLADTFIKNGHRVIGIDNLIGGYLDNVPPEVEFHQHDLTDYDYIANILKDVDIVYHTAATAYEGFSVFSPRFVTKHIVDASVSVITAAVANKVKRFINCSSMARYGHQEVPFREDMPVRPQDPYAIGKVAVENLLINIAETHGMEWVNVIPHNIIGPRQKYDDPYRNVASIMINLMLQGRQPIIYGDGEQKRCFSFIQDDLNVLEKMAFADNVVGEHINIGPDEEFVTINELARVIAKKLDFDLDPEYFPDRPMEVKLATCSADKARKLLGYKTEYTLDQGIEEMIDYIKNRGEKPFKYHIDLEIINDQTPQTWKNKLF
ncbi:NAD-dependent epimerase/dehydratase family protein [Patescibacteria group bacterium]